MTINQAGSEDKRTQQQLRPITPTDCVKTLSDATALRRGRSRSLLKKRQKDLQMPRPCAVASTLVTSGLQRTGITLKSRELGALHRTVAEALGI